MKSLFTISFSILAVLLPAVWSTKVTHCKNSPGLFPEKVEVQECSEQPCNVYRGEDLVMNVTFRSPGYLVRLAPKVIAMVKGVEVNYPVGDNACPDMVNTPCPLVENELVIYSFKMHIWTIYPKIALGIQFSLTDKEKSDTDVVCLKLDIIVADR